MHPSIAPSYVTTWSRKYLITGTTIGRLDSLYENLAFLQDLHENLALPK